MTKSAYGWLLPWLHIKNKIKHWFWTYLQTQSDFHTIWLLSFIENIVYTPHSIIDENLSMNPGSLFCFVCPSDISQTMALHATLLVSSESSEWIGVHWLGLRLFGAMVWKVLIIESFSQWKLNKIETAFFGKPSAS